MQSKPSRHDEPQHGAAAGEPPAGAATSTPGSSAEDVVIPVLSEQLDVSTRWVEQGSGVRVRKEIEEREELVDLPLAREQVDVERVAIGRPLEEPVGVRYEGDTLIVPVVEEVIVVEKRLVLKEELRITRRRSEHRDPRRVTLRREVPHIERLEGEHTSSVQDERVATGTQPEGAGAEAVSSRSQV